MDGYNGTIRDIMNGGELKFKYFEEEISDSISAVYNSPQVIGRSVPFMGYSNTEARRLSLTIHFISETEGGEYSAYNSVTWLQAKLYPTYLGDNMQPPPILELTLGTWLILKGILQNLSVTWKAPFDINSGVPMHAVVPFELTVLGWHSIPSPLEHNDIIGLRR